ncbi:MAG TPA: hypothetical protein VH933_06695 [Aestuariivirgaceae bacterium]
MERRDKTRNSACILPSAGARQMTPRHRRRWLLATTAIALAGSLAFSSSAWTSNECGDASSGSVTCTAANNPYSDGIAYDLVNDLTLILAPGVTVTPVSGTPSSISGVSVSSNGYDIEVLSLDTTTYISISGDPTTGDNADGIYISDAASATVEWAGSIATDGRAAYGLYIYGTAGNATVDVSGTIVTKRVYSSGIAVQEVAGDTAVGVSGSITTYDRSYGVFILDTYGTVLVSVSGDIITGKNFALAPARGSAGIEIDDTSSSVVATLDSGGTITTYGASAYGIGIRRTGVASDGDTDYITVDVSGDITTHGDTSPASTCVRASAMRS